MLNYRTLAYKGRMKNANGETVLDLLSSTYNHNENIYGTFVIVNKYYVARPDLIALAYYGDDSYGDLLCKVNGISNPFELAEDTMLRIPDVEELVELCKYSGNSSDLIKSEYDTLTSVNRNNKKKLVSEKRSPNEQTLNDSNYVIDKSLGLVFY